MMNADLKNIERRTIFSFFQDGLWDIFLGLFILGWGIMMLTEMPSLTGAWWIALFFTVLGVKRKLTYPRIGYVKFGSKTQKARIKLLIMLGIVFLLGVFLMLLFSFNARPQWLVDYFPLFFNGMLAIIVCIIAYWARVNRFYLYAALIFLGAVFHQWLDFEWAFGFIGAGAIIGLLGMIIFISFLHKYPKVSQEDLDASQ